MGKEVEQPIALPDTMQEFPRVMLFEFSDDHTEQSRPVATLTLHDAWPKAFTHGPLVLESGKTQGYTLPSQLGDKLTNNSVVDDGYRFHDAFHIGIMAKLGWSPVMRSLLHVKRRANPKIDEIDDGARAIIFEESLFDFLGMSELIHGVSIEENIDLTFASLSVKNFFKSRSLEKNPPTYSQIEDALLEGAELFHQIRQNLGGYVIANLDNKSAIYQSK